MPEDPRLQELLQQITMSARNDPHDQLVRQVARLRARDTCEYCLQQTIGQFQVDHIVPAALWSGYVTAQLGGVAPLAGRRGPDHLDNFAWCCPFCNLGKRQRVSHRLGSRLFRLFDPRLDRWTDHLAFTNNYLFIVGITPVGIATQFALGFNNGEIGGPLGTRHDSILDGRYPPAWLLRPDL